MLQIYMVPKNAAKAIFCFGPSPAHSRVEFGMSPENRFGPKPTKWNRPADHPEVVPDPGAGFGPKIFPYPAQNWTE